MNMKSLKTQFIGAIAMVLVAAIAMGSSTFAWFSLNNTVTVTGMSVKTEVNNNLLIAPAANADSTNAPTAAMPTSDKYGTFLIQSVGNLLEPVSSTSGKYNEFWYTSATNVETSGNAKSDVYTDYHSTGLTVPAGGQNNFNINYGTTGAVGYFDYVFALQATNSGSDGVQYINMNKCNLIYSGATADTTGRAIRAALLVQECTNNDGSANDAKTDVINTVTILGCTDTAGSSAYFDKTGGSSNTTPDAVSAANALADVTNFNASATVISSGIPVHETKYYKCTLRVWLEGEDSTCNNATYAKLTDEWSLDLGFTLASKVSSNDDSTENAVQTITKKVKTAYAVTAGSGTSVMIAGTQFYSYATTTPASGTLYADKATISVDNGTGAKFYLFTDNLANAEDVTNFVTINAAG